MYILKKNQNRYGPVKEPSLHNNLRGHVRKHLSATSVLNIKGTIPVRSKLCQKHSIFGLCWAEALLLEARWQSKMLWFYFLCFMRYCFYNLANSVVCWALEGKLHRNCQIGSQQRAYVHSFTLKTTSFVFQQICERSAAIGHRDDCGSTCSCRGNKPQQNNNGISAPQQPFLLNFFIC